MNIKELEKAHIANRRQLEKAITQINLVLNSAIKSNNKEREYVSTRLLVFLWMSWAETSLNALVYKQPHVNEVIRRKVLGVRREIDKWHILIDEFFKKHYLSKKQTSIKRHNIGHSAYTKYQTLKEIIEKEISIFIEIRNRLAHGQWKVALNTEATSKSQDITTKIWTLSKKEILYLKSTLVNLNKILNDLICSKFTFERDFDPYIARIDKAKYDFDEKFEWYLKHLKNRKKK
jgi:hypothetical protein